ncbi:hypothetical protein [Klebsiella michiganensis]|uniref:hypothetical protein n=1 Tax=Klebsiella michiganensis TaxID=1134687 RepID=UPI001F118FC1|nr:hypothetical protein [Klebsiella michiganensis]
MRTIVLIPVISSLLLTACNLERQGFKAKSKNLIEEKQEQIARNEKKSADQIALIKKNQESRERFELSHPEVPIDKADEMEGGRRNGFKHALNQLNFVTRDPQSDDMNKIYINVGSFKLTMTRFLLAVKSQMTECKRASAYAEVDYKKICEPSITKELMDFANMNNDPNIPALTKQTALGEAMYGGSINFGHAARLAIMHYKLCGQQKNSGYVLMDTAAVPCSGKGDVLSGYVADKLGVIN